MILSCQEMKDVETRAFAAGATAEALMEKAGKGIADAIQNFFPTPGVAVIYAGKGNNAGDAFVAARHLYAVGGSISASAIGNRFLFTGREWLGEAGIYDCRNRVYSAKLGRFLQTDPIRFGARDVNLYRYVGNGPLGWRDPMGLKSKADCESEFKRCMLNVGQGMTDDLTGFGIYTSGPGIMLEAGATVATYLAFGGLLAAIVGAAFTITDAFSWTTEVGSILEMWDAKGEVCKDLRDKCLRCATDVNLEQ